MGRGEEDAEHDGTIRNGVRERHVAVGALFATLGLVGAVERFPRACLYVSARPVLLGKQDVETDCGDISLHQRIDELRHRLTRPWPSADEMNELVVDVDDADGLVEIVRSRAPALILIENEVIQIASEWGKHGPEGEREDIGADDDQPVGSPLPQSVVVRPEIHRIDDSIRRGRNLGWKLGIVAERSAGSTEACPARIAAAWQRRTRPAKGAATA